MASSFFISRRPPLVVSADQTVSPPAATASASAFIPSVQLVVPAPAASATASAPVPAIQLRVSPPAASATASAPLPTVQVRVSPGVASAAASSPAATVPIAAPTASASAAAPAPTMPIKVAGNTIILGYSNQSLVTEDIPTLERGVGRKFSGLRQNQQVTVTSWSFANSDYDSGHKPATYRSIQLNTGLYTDVTAGTWDTNLTAIANNLIASGRWSPANPAIVTFMHEVALASNDFLGTSQQYIDAFRYIRNLFDSLGATVRSKDGRYLGGPAIFAYVGWNRMFTNGAVDSPAAGKSYTDYDPDQGSSPAPAGTTYYTLVGSDPYNDLVSGSLKYGTNAATLLDDIKAQAVARGKDWMIGEMGVADGPTAQNHLDKAAWLDSVHAYLAAIKSTDPSGVCRYLFSTQEDGNLYNWDSSPDALAAGSRLALDPYFVQNSATSFGNTPGVGVSVVVPAATAAASAPLPVPQLKVLPAAASVSASAPVPTVTGSTANQTVSPPPATASASSPTPTVQLQVSPAAATASASSPTPTVQLQVAAPAATSSASAPLPTAQLRISPPAGTASASGLVPTLQLRVSPLAATATGSAPLPVPQLRILPASAAAAASALVPADQLRVPLSVATASASAPIPTVTAALLPPPTTTAIFGYVNVGARGRVRSVVAGSGGVVAVGATAAPAAGGSKGIVRV